MYCFYYESVREERIQQVRAWWWLQMEMRPSAVDGLGRGLYTRREQQPSLRGYRAARRQFPQCNAKQSGRMMSQNAPSKCSPDPSPPRSRQIQANIIYKRDVEARMGAPVKFNRSVRCPHRRLSGLTYRLKSSNKTRRTIICVECNVQSEERWV